MTKYTITKRDFHAYLKKNEAFLMAMDDIAFRTAVHGKAHHCLEIQVLHCLNTGAALYPKRVAVIERCLELWDERGLSHDLPEYRFAKYYVDAGYDYIEGKIHTNADLKPFAPTRLSEEEAARFDRVQAATRSVYEFDASRDVDDALLDTLVDAALWAPNGGNLQPTRYLIIHEKNAPGLFKSSTAIGAPVHLVVALSSSGMRGLVSLGGETLNEDTFMNHRNNPLNCGSAVQNIALAATACGLASSWQTFAPGEVEALKARFNLPDSLHLVTYLDIGYASRIPAGFTAKDVEARVLARV